MLFTRGEKSSPEQSGVTHKQLQTNQTKQGLFLYDLPMALIDTQWLGIEYSSFSFTIKHSSDSTQTNGMKSV